MSKQISLATGHTLHMSRRAGVGRTRGSELGLHHETVLSRSRAFFTRCRIHQTRGCAAVVGDLTFEAKHNAEQSHWQP